MLGVFRFRLSVALPRHACLERTFRGRHLLCLLFARLDPTALHFPAALLHQGRRVSVVLLMSLVSPLSPMW